MIWLWELLLWLLVLEPFGIVAPDWFELTGLLCSLFESLFAF